MRNIFSTGGPLARPMNLVSKYFTSDPLPTRTISTVITVTNTASSLPASLKISSQPTTALRTQRSHFSTSTSQLAKKKNQAPKSEHYSRIRILKQNMYDPPPPPLRMARLRHLRHWTIHRAWLLFRRKQREAALKERARMHAGMFNACEELRTVTGPDEKSEGYLYRVAMEKKGVYGLDSVPIEYARLQTDSPAKVPWNHDWKR